MDKKTYDALSDEQKDALEQFKKCYEDKEITLPSGNIYIITRLKHKERLKVFTRFDLLDTMGVRFFDSDEFKIVEDVVEGKILFQGMQLCKRSDHWDNHPEDFFVFYKAVMGAISYPFLSVQG